MQVMRIGNGARGQGVSHGAECFACFQTTGVSHVARLMRPSDKSFGQWYATHPDHRVHRADDRSVRLMKCSWEWPLFHPPSLVAVFPPHDVFFSPRQSPNTSYILLLIQGFLTPITASSTRQGAQEASH